MDKINFKYSTDELLKHILTPLKLFKNKRQVSKTFKFSDVFPTDHAIDQDKEIVVLVDHYLNALRFYKILETLKNNNISLEFYRDDVLELVEIEKKKNYISFYKIYHMFEFYKYLS